MGFDDPPYIKNETYVVNEIFLCARFLKNNNIQIEWTLEDWWKNCRDIFCIIDASSLDFFWYKYEWRYEQRFNTNYTNDYTQKIFLSIKYR